MVFPNRDSDLWGEGEPQYQPLVDELERIRVLELGPVLAREPEIDPGTLRAPEGHLSAASNVAVARAVRRGLERMELLPPRP